MFLPLETFEIVVISDLNKSCQTPKSSHGNTQGFFVLSVDREKECSDVTGLFLCL